MKTSKTHLRLRRFQKFLSIGTVVTLAIVILGSGLAQGGLLGQTTGGGDKDKKTDTGTTGTPPPTVVTTTTGSGADTKGVTTGSAGTLNPAQIQQAVAAGAGSQQAGSGTGGTPGVIVVQSPGQQGGQGPNQQIPQAKLPPASEVAKILSKHVFTGRHGLPLFGYSNFESARTGIEQRIKFINDINSTPRVADPTSGPVGPQLGFDVINQPSPERYQLGPGDTFTMRVVSPTSDPVNQDMVVDSLGSVTIPQTGEKVVVRGQTLAQLEHTLKVAVRLGLKGAEVSLQMKELRSMPIYILGQSYAPGTYQVPSVMSLFNAIYTSGGPNENGTLRRIKVTRTNGYSKEFDLYRLLILGDRTQDIPLQPGDVINILPAGDRVAFEGDVYQPAIYELKAGEKLQDVVKWSSGIKPSGVAQKISIEKTTRGVERILLDVDATSKSPVNNPILRDGDDINVYSIRPELVNEVTIEGAVDQPHHYGLTKGMRVADLIDAARGLLPEAYEVRADLFRRNDDLTHKLIPIDLKKAMERIPAANLLLEEDDRLHIYAESDVRWMGERQVKVEGAVNKPGTIYRADNLTVRDVLLQAGGLSPEAYDLLAFVQRTNLDGTVGQLFKINLVRAMRGDSFDNVILQDRDVLRVFTVRESNFIAEQVVTIKGAVQKPGTLPLSPNMTARDALLLAGNLLPTAFSQFAFIQRTNLDGTPGPLIRFDLVKALAGDPTSNPTLFSKDAILVYTLEQEDFQPKYVVDIVGAVQTPAQYTLSKGMKVHDLVVLSGKPLPDAYTERAYLQSTNLDKTVGELKIIDLNKALAEDPANDLVLKPGDKLTIYTKEQTTFQPKQTVTISGAVQRPGSFQRATNMTLQDLLRISGGATAKASERVEIAKARVPQGTPILRYTMADALGPAGAAVKLEDGDIVAVPEDATIMEQPMTITVKGNVRNPGPYLVSSTKEHLSVLIHRAGGILPDGFVKGAQFRRKLDAPPVEQIIVEHILKVLTDVQKDEFQRALARSEVDKLRAVSEAQKLGVPAVSVSSAGTAAPTQQNPAGIPNNLTGSPAVTAARKFEPADLVPIGNINVNVANALKHPGGPDDIILKDGDEINIPQLPISVIVTGAVLSPTSVKFEPGKSISYYVLHSGGFMADAAKDQVIVIRSSGNIIKASLNTKLELGDTVFIPSKVEADHLRDKGAEFSNQLAQLTNAGLLVAVVHALIK